MRRREHERLMHDRDRTITRLEQQNRDLLDRLMYITDRPWTPPPQVEVPLTGNEDLGYAWAPEQSLDALDGDPVADYATE